MVNNTMLTYHFVDSDLDVEIFFEKEEATESVGLILKLVVEASAAQLYWEFKKSSF